VTDRTDGSFQSVNIGQFQTRPAISAPEPALMEGFIATYNGNMGFVKKQVAFWAFVHSETGNNLNVFILI
jgi:hypothetical protein